jgi:hypothetical protein
MLMNNIFGWHDDITVSPENPLSGVLLSFLSGKLPLSKCGLSQLFLNNSTFKQISVPVVAMGTLHPVFAQLLHTRIASAVVKITFPALYKTYENNITDANEAERLMYRLTTSLTAQHFTPNFIRYLADWRCSFGDVISRSSPAVAAAFKASADDVYRPDVAKPTDPVQFVLLERGAPTTLYKFVISPEATDDSLMALLFQIIYTVHVMNSFGMRHGDLHSNNILVGETDADLAQYIPEPSLKEFDVYRIPVRRLAKIYDWDFGGIYRSVRPLIALNQQRLGKDILFYDADDRKAVPSLPFISNSTAMEYCRRVSSCDANTKADVFTVLSNVYQTMGEFSGRFPRTQEFIQRHINQRLLETRWGSYYGHPHRLCDGPLSYNCDEGQRPPDVMSVFTGTSCRRSWEPKDCVISPPLEMLKDQEFERYHLRYNVANDRYFVPSGSTFPAAALTPDSARPQLTYGAWPSSAVYSALRTSLRLPNDPVPQNL